MEKKFYEKKSYLYLNLAADILIICSAALNAFGIMSAKVFNIICGPIALIFLSVFVYMLWRAKKDKKIRNESEETIEAPYILRGENLDRQIGDQILRNQNEDDWTYVKRAFPIVCETNPSGAVSILFGKSITELDEANKWLAGTFLSSKKKKYDIEKFLRGFGNSDPAYN